MASTPDVDDLRLVLAIDATRSVGAAARLLRVAQPSASQRLARLERRVGVALFDRDTRGARPTAAGAELVRQASHILGHLERAFESALAAAARPVLRVGTLASLAESIFPVLVDVVTSDLHQVVDHGDQLIEWVAEGSLDGAYVGLAGQIPLPRTVAVHAVGSDELVLLVPDGVAPPGRGRLPLRDREVAYGTLDTGADEVHARIASLGAVPRPAATVPTAIATARRTAQPAVVPRSATRAWRRPHDSVVRLPWRYRNTISLVTPLDADDRLVASIPVLAKALGLERTS